MLDILLAPALLLGGMGLIFGLVLAYSAQKFHVETNEKLQQITEALPCSNCGGCGYAGCAAFAGAVLNGEVKPNKCPVGGEESVKQISEIMGTAFEPPERETAYIRCCGGKSKSKPRYDYAGLNNCKAAKRIAGEDPKSCVYGCLGGGSCEAVCIFNAISIEDGIAIINPEKCTACALCIKACPKKLISLVPYNSRIHVACLSKEPAREVRKNCKVGCIACKLCIKSCAFSAIYIRDNCAHINYTKCTQCNACIEACPSKCIMGECYLETRN